MKTLLIALLLSSTVVVDNKTYKGITDLTLTANLVCFKQADKVYCFSKNLVVLDGKQLEKDEPVRVYIERIPPPPPPRERTQEEKDKELHAFVLQKIEEEYAKERAENGPTFYKSDFSDLGIAPPVGLNYHSEGSSGYNDAGLNMPALQNYSNLLAEEGMDNDWVETIIAEGYL